MSDKEDGKGASGGEVRKTKKELHQENPEKVSDDSEEEGGDEVDGASSSSLEEILRRLMGGLSLTKKKTEGEKRKEKPEQLLEEVSLDGVAKYVSTGRARKVVTMAGAGISTSAGIPDFRSPGTGLYHNLQKYDLPNPQVCKKKHVRYVQFDPSKLVGNNEALTLTKKCLNKFV